MEHQANGFMGCDYNIERMFNKLKHFRSIATRYDTLAARFMAWRNIAAIPLWLK